MKQARPNDFPTTREQAVMRNRNQTTRLSMLFCLLCLLSTAAPAQEAQPGKPAIEAYKLKTYDGREHEAELGRLWVRENCESSANGRLIQLVQKLLVGRRLLKAIAPRVR